MRSNRGFTLIELMVVVVVIAILAAIAIPSYQVYIQKRDLAVAKQETLRIAAELEKFKAKNFSYTGFDPSFIYSSFDSTAGTLAIPVDAASGEEKYTLKLMALNDVTQPLTGAGVDGLGWAMVVERAKSGSLPKQPKNYDLLLTSEGLRCMSKTNNAFDDFDDTLGTCADNDSASEAWE